MIGQLLSALLGGGAQRLVSTIFGDRAARERYTAEEQMAVQTGFQAEFSSREGRTWWDSLVDGLNRLARPLMTFGVIGLFVWAVVDPPAFSLAMLALRNVPEMLWYIFLAVIGFWFGTKMIEKAPRRMRGPSAEDVKRVHDLEAAHECRDLGVARQASWCDPAGESPAQVRSSVRLVASLAWLTGDGSCEA